jgi:hypothetical protein
MLFFAFLAKWLRRAKLVYRITDFYPEVIIAAWGKPNVPFLLLQRLTWFLRRRVDEFQVLGEDQRALLIAGGVAPERIILKRDISPISFIAPTKRIVPPAELSGRMVLLYSGNLGVAHEIDTVVAGLAQHHRDGTGRIGLWLNASGSAVETVATQLQAAKVPFAHTEPVALDQLPSLLASADIHLITLRSAFSGLVVPSKLYGCLASGRPILFVGPASSDVHLMCTKTMPLRYERVEPGDNEGFARALDRLVNSKLSLRETF